MKTTLTVSLIVVSAVTGCGNLKEWNQPPTPEQQAARDARKLQRDQPWRRANWRPDGKLKIAIVDPARHEPNPNVTLYQANDHLPRHTVLAFISADDDAGQEARIVVMMLDYARHIGATGVALLGNEKPNENLALVNPIWQHTGRRVFRANIIIEK